MAAELGELTARAQAWLEADPDPLTQAALAALVAAATAGRPDALAELDDAVGSDIAFGTAGLRAAVGAGPNRMNIAVVTRTAAALGGWLAEAVAGATPALVAVGYDARHGSASFATTTARVLTAAGCRVVLLPGPLPTPILAATVRRLDADAGVMVTASHNPAADNGYKVYLGGRVSPDPGAGVQIIPPVDAQIAERIRTGPRACDVPLADDGWQVLGTEAVDHYVASTAALVRPGPRALRVVATALHGVGADTLERALGAAGFAPPLFVASQRDPDPDFPTVAFPNPEEPGALDEALALAESSGADLVVAVDPDADRCALAIRDPDATIGADDIRASGWRRLTGDETGALLGEYLLARRQAGTDPRVRVDPDEPPTVAASIVSSSLLQRIAAHHRVRSRSTLTGFKWISRVPGLIYGYEEAIGYCVDPASVRDKDGIATAVVACEMVAALVATGRTVPDLLDELSLRHGVHATAPVTLRLRDLGAVAPLLAGLVAHPPAVLGGITVTAVSDLSRGGGTPATPGVRIDCGDEIRVIVRPSGTEPKIKGYIQVVHPVPRASDLVAVRRSVGERLGLVVADVTRLLT